MSPSPQRQLETDAIYELLSASERRRVVSRLQSRDEATLEDLAGTIAGADAGPSDERRATIALVHNHLPRLSDAGVVDYDRDRGAVARGDRFEDVLETVDAAEPGSIGSQSPLLE